ncbi:MAG TPA: flagellin [Phycisphaerales bacterium]|nr:flagellin [Phycisphaerales bacterium]
MSRINTNVQSLVAQRVLGRNNYSLGVALERLSTGLKINRGKDDPAGLIASENLRSEQKALDQAVANAERADQVVNIAEGGLQEVSSLLTELQTLVTASASGAGLSTEEKEANQSQIDSILQTIDRIAGATNFQGIKLLNGNLDFKTSGVNSSNVTDFKVNGAKFTGASLAVNVSVTQSAQQAGLFMSMGAAQLNLSAATAQLVMEIGGPKGSRQFSFAQSASLNTIRDSINQFTDVTGLTATVSGTGIRLISSEFGSDEFVSVKVSNAGGLATASSGIYNLNATNTAAAGAQAAEFNAATTGVRDAGQNVAGTINGIVASAKGKNLKLNTDFLDVELTLGTTQSQTRGNVNGAGGAGTAAFSITGGGAEFQLSSKVDISGKVGLGIQDISARKLGNAATGMLDSLGRGKANDIVSGSLSNAQKVVGEAIKQVSSLRGRLGAFQKNVVGATIRSLGINIENTAAAQSIIRDADFASETASLTRSQILVSSATNILSLANSAPQSALQLLG